MPDVLAALVAFVAEHQRCGDLDGGRDDTVVWLACSCGAWTSHPANASPPRTGTKTPGIRQGKRNDLLRVPALVHVADHLVRLPAHMFQVLSAHVKRSDNPAALGAVVSRLAGPAGRGRRAYAQGRRLGGD
jgi:hypothetical protein